MIHPITDLERAQAAEIERLLQLVADSIFRDAQRYRWLLDNGPDVFAAAYYNTNTPEAVSAAIDAAMKGQT